MRTIRYNENALKDFQDGLNYYDDISVSLADRFEEDFWKTIERIKSDPFHFQQRYSEVRIAFNSISICSAFCCERRDYRSNYCGAQQTTLLEKP